MVKTMVKTQWVSGEDFPNKTNPIIYWLVVSTYPSEKYIRSSVGMNIPFPTEWKNPLKSIKIH